MNTQPLNLPLSLTGQRWCWRGTAAEITDDPANAPLDDLVTQLLLSRGCTREALEAYSAPSIRAFMPNPSVFADMDKAAERLADAVEKQENVTIFGDYDVDGATSAALLVRLLRSVGLTAQAYIPDRLMEGYGPSGAALVKLAEAGSTLIVTVDCGAQAFEALDMAAAVGVDVVVVDHHQCATALPKALALVNPNRLDESAEGAQHGHLAAVGMAFLLGAALLRTLRTRGTFTNRAEPKLLDLLDLVALGTVADVAALHGLNRAFVAQGLKVIAAGQNIGLQALGKVAGLKRAVQCGDLGFLLGPRINAGGRVGQSDLGVRLLTTEDEAEAESLAAALDKYNHERRAIEALVQAEAEAQAQSQDNRAVILVCGDTWHPGVIGIVAGRLKEKFNRPALVIACDAGVGKGSGRSIAGVDLGAAVLAAKDVGLLVAGGGHKMAAGLTVNVDQIAALQQFLEERLSAAIAHAQIDRTLVLDALVAPGGVTAGLVDALEAGGPYGMGWPQPRVAAGPYRIIKADRVGTDHLRLILAGQNAQPLKAMAFRQADSPLGQTLSALRKEQAIYIAGRVKRDDWAGRNGVEMHIDDVLLSDS